MRRRLSRACRRGVVVRSLLFGAPTRRELARAVDHHRAQRDAIYEIVIPHLTAIGDVWLCVKRREFAEAERMGRVRSPRWFQPSALVTVDGMPVLRPASRVSWASVRQSPCAGPSKLKVRVAASNVMPCQ